MDKKSRQILKHLNSVESESLDELLRKFGATYKASIEYLLTEQYIVSQVSTVRFANRETGKHDPPVEVTSNIYRITGHGIDYLEHYRLDQIHYWVPIVLSNTIALASLIVSVIAICK